MITDATPHYAAFISYAHADEAVAARLHKALETFPVPKHLRRQGRTTRPIFRDLAELTAAHSLSEKIHDAVNNSHVLIVLCSPAAKASHWVNEEIKLFREIHGDGAILSALIDGTPATSFPEALIQDGREPLAASLGHSKAGFRLGVTQLAAGILGTGLDELVQRGAKRRSRLMGAGMAASLLLSGIMGFATFQAVDARNEAQSARGDAEVLIQYMIKDLKTNLEPLGRLDLLEGVGREALDYYDKQDITTLPDDSLNRQAATRQLLAEVYLDAGRTEEAQSEIEASADMTREVLSRNPDDADAIFAHAQSEFWVGEYYKLQGEISQSEKPWREYDRLVQILYQKDPSNIDWVMEAGWAQNNLGVWARESFQSKRLSEGKFYYDNAINYFKKAQKLRPESMSSLDDLANSLSGRAFVELSTGRADTARNFKKEELSLWLELKNKFPDNVPIRVEYVKTRMDYYDGFYLSHSKEQRVEIQKTLNEFHELAKYDHENFGNMRYFLNAATDNFESLNLTDLKSRQLLITEILSLYEKSGKEDVQFYKSILAVLNIKVSFLEGVYSKAEDDLYSLEQLVRNIPISKRSEGKLYYGIFSRHQDLNQRKVLRSHARKLLNILNSEFGDLKYPTIMEKKISAFSELGLCFEVEPLAKELVARGFRTETWKSELNCS